MQKTEISVLITGVTERKESFQLTLQNGETYFTPGKNFPPPTKGMLLHFIISGSMVLEVFMVCPQQPVKGRKISTSTPLPAIIPIFKPSPQELLASMQSQCQDMQKRLKLQKQKAEKEAQEHDLMALNELFRRRIAMMDQLDEESFPLEERRKAISNCQLAMEILAFGEDEIFKRDCSINPGKDCFAELLRGKILADAYKEDVRNNLVGENGEVDLEKLSTSKVLTFPRQLRKDGIDVNFFELARNYCATL